MAKVQERSKRAATIETIRTVLAADCACSEVAFDQDGLVVTLAAAWPGRRRYHLPKRPLLIVTMGQGVVVSCHADWILAMQELLGQSHRDRVFAAPLIAEVAQFVAREGAELRGPSVGHVCAPESLRLAKPPSDVTVTIVEGSDVVALYRHPGFENALSYRPDLDLPDVAAAVASSGDRIVGIAGMSADCEVMWQIGIDVIPAARGRGVGRALVSAVTQLAFEHDRVPFYTADVGNVRSHALAVSLGYWPMWTQLVSRDQSPQ